MSVAVVPQHQGPGAGGGLSRVGPTVVAGVCAGTAGRPPTATAHPTLPIRPSPLQSSSGPDCLVFRYSGPVHKRSRLSHLAQGFSPGSPGSPGQAVGGAGLPVPCPCRPSAPCCSCCPWSRCGSLGPAPVSSRACSRRLLLVGGCGFPGLI